MCNRALSPNPFCSPWFWPSLGGLLTWMLTHIPLKARHMNVNEQYVLLSITAIYLNWIGYLEMGKKKENPWRCPRWESDFLKSSFAICSWRKLEGIDISLTVTLRCKWSTWDLRNFNLIPESEGVKKKERERGVFLNSRRKTERCLCLYVFYGYLIKMHLCLQFALPRLVYGWAL